MNKGHFNFIRIPSLNNYGIKKNRQETFHRHSLVSLDEFPFLAIMIWSGLLIYWANDVYRLGWGDTTILKFFPDSFNEALNIPFHLADGMSFHFVFMWFFTFNGIFYSIYLLISKEWKYLIPNKGSFKEAWLVLLHDLHLKKTAPSHLKYNAAQRIAYTLVILMGVGSLLTGLAIFKPIQLQWLCNLLGGYETARILHFSLTILFCLFFVVHIVQVAIAGWNNFAAMIRGFEVHEISMQEPITTKNIESNNDAVEKPDSE